jgi:UDP-3-O-[3-hydroxymyristoyl] glucosamine N-acyltransferase
MSATLRELADRFGCELHGDPALRVVRVGTLAGAGPDALTFLANPLYRSQLSSTAAGAVVLAERDRAACPVACLVHPEPYVVYAKIAASLYPPPIARPGVHATAVVAPNASVAPSAEVGPHVSIGEGSTVAAAAVLGAGTVLGARVVVGAATRLAPRVTVLDGVRIGARCIVHPGAVIGADGFGFAPDAGRWQKIPQVGAVIIGDDVEIGANTTIDRGAIEDTVIEDGVKLDNLVQIAHNVRVGAHTIMAAMSGAAGSTKIGKRCMIGGGVVMVNSLEICDDVLFTFRSIVTKSVSRPGTYSGHLPAEEAGQWRRNAAHFRKLDSLAQRLADAERALESLGVATRKRSKQNKNE